MLRFISRPRQLPLGFFLWRRETSPGRDSRGRSRSFLVVGLKEDFLVRARELRPENPKGAIDLYKRKNDQKSAYQSH